MKPYTLYSDNYQTYGSDRPIDFFEADPVHCAIDGPGGVNNMFTCAGNPRRRQIGLNRAFMAQRCSKNTQSWDGYCDMYLAQEWNADFTNKEFHMFIKDCLSRMFCQNDTSIPGSQCIERCEQYNPTSPNSVSVCMTQGDLVYRSSDKVSAVDTLYPQTGKLQNTEPIRFTKCPKVCNIFDADKLSDKNIPLTIACRNGIAMDVIENLLENIVSAGKQSLVTNGDLKRIMDYYVQNGSLKPGFSTLGFGPYVSSMPIFTPAVNVGIPANTDLVVNEDITQVQMVPASAQPQPVIPSPQPSTEAFKWFRVGGGNKDNKGTNALEIILGIAILIAIIAVLVRRLRK